MADNKNVTPKPNHYPEKVRDMLLLNRDIPDFIEHTNNMELSNEIIANVDFLDFVKLYKEFWEYVIALSYGATNIPLRPRALLVSHADNLASAILNLWHDSDMVKVCELIGFEREKGEITGERVY